MSDSTGQTLAEARVELERFRNLCKTASRGDVLTNLSSFVDAVLKIAEAVDMLRQQLQEVAGRAG